MPFFSPSENVETFDDKIMTVIPVIVSFNTQGSMKPLYVRIHDVSLPVVGCWCQPNINTLDFHCRIQDGNVMKEIKLTYHLQRRIWTTRL